VAGPVAFDAEIIIARAAIAAIGSRFDVSLSLSRDQSCRRSMISLVTDNLQ
jgi:hypothetical protein